MNNCIYHWQLYPRAIHADIMQLSIEILVHIAVLSIHNYPSPASKISGFFCSDSNQQKIKSFAYYMIVIYMWIVIHTHTNTQKEMGAVVSLQPP